MADDSFPDTYTTKTTVTTTESGSTTVCSFNEGYIKSLPGILRISQIIVGLVYWIDLAANYLVGRGFVITFVVIAWVCTIILFVLFVFMIVEKITVINWPLTEFINNAIWTVCNLIGVILVLVTITKYRVYFGQVLAFICAVVMTGLYGFHTYLAIRSGAVTFSRTTSSGARDVQT